MKKRLSQFNKYFPYISFIILFVHIFSVQLFMKDIERRIQVSVGMSRTEIISMIGIPDREFTLASGIDPQNVPIINKSWRTGISYGPNVSSFLIILFDNKGIAVAIYQVYV